MKHRHNVKTSAVIALYVETKRDNGFISFNASPVWVGLRPSEMARIDRGETLSDDSSSRADRIRNIGGWQDGDGLINGTYLNNLRVTSQGNDDRDRADRGVLYGFEVTYRDVFSVDKTGAELMALTLGKIDRRMTALYEKYGTAATFGAYLLRVADAIGATRIVVNRESLPSNSSYDKRDHRIMSLSDGAQFVDGLIRTWAESFSGATS